MAKRTANGSSHIPHEGATTPRAGYIPPDGPPAHEATLTERDKAFLARCKDFPYQDMDIWLTAVPIVAWRPPQDDSAKLYRDAIEFSMRNMMLSINSLRPRIETEQCGAFALQLGSAILAFGKRPPGIIDPGHTLLRRELGLVQAGLAEAGAEEICGLVFGAGYLLLAKPIGLPLYDTATPVEAEQLWQELALFQATVHRLDALTQQASAQCYGSSTPETAPGREAPRVTRNPGSLNS